jgi:hypothetical protein
MNIWLSKSTSARAKDTQGIAKFFGRAPITSDLSSEDNEQERECRTEDSHVTEEQHAQGKMLMLTLPSLIAKHAHAHTHTGEVWGERGGAGDGRRRL